MHVYHIRKDGQSHSETIGLNQAIVEIKALRDARHPSDESVTFSVENIDGYLLASATTRRILGEFNKASWGGPRGDTSIDCGSEAFDATEAVLQLPHLDLMSLSDNTESTDSIGRAHVDWPAHCTVVLTQAICEYFGVMDLSEITPEALAFALELADILPEEEVIVTLSVMVTLRVRGGASVKDFLDNLYYLVQSKTDGIKVDSTEIIGFQR